LDLVGRMTSEARAVLALNPGSSSLKAAVRDPTLRLAVQVERLGTDKARATISAPGKEPASTPVSGDFDDAVAWVRAVMEQSAIEPQAVTHRVVHGGPVHDRPTLIDEKLVSYLREIIPLAPLHLPGAITAIELARQTWPRVPHVACFDTAFHHGLPDEARCLPVANDVAAMGVRRYGFHGIAVQSVVDGVPDLGPAVIAHLGSGCSVTAVADAQSRHTTMSLTPTGGTMSATRSGDLDPEIVLFVLAHPDWDTDAVRNMLTHRSGIAALSGGIVDMRDLLSARADSRVDLAIRAFTRSVAMAIASCATALDEWHALVFTGGIGEHSSEIREEICARLLSLPGAVADSRSTSASASDQLAARGIRVLTVPADEEAVMDRQTRQLLWP
jgi:acetate kinase